jgi:hypothetical protein
MRSFLKLDGGELKAKKCTRAAMAIDIVQRDRAALEKLEMPRQRSCLIFAFSRFDCLSNSSLDLRKRSRVR